LNFQLFNASALLSINPELVEWINFQFSNISNLDLIENFEFQIEN